MLMPIEHHLVDNKSKINQTRYSNLGPLPEPQSLTPYGKDLSAHGKMKKINTT